MLIGGNCSGLYYKHYRHSDLNLLDFGFCYKGQRITCIIRFCYAYVAFFLRGMHKQF